MKAMKSKGRLDNVILSPKSDHEIQYTSPITPLDTLTVKVLSLRLPDEPLPKFSIQVTFCDQLILTNVIQSIGTRQDIEENVIAMGTMTYDPSDYEKMSIFADNPLVAHIHPLKNIEAITSSQSMTHSSITHVLSSSFTKDFEEISCCNVDILKIFLGDEVHETMCIKKRMQPKMQPPLLQQKSWDNLPLITMELSVTRDTLNISHHKVLKNANWMKLTLVAAYNMLIPFDDEYLYTAASKMPTMNSNLSNSIFDRGYRPSRQFHGINFYPKWESLRVVEDLFTKGYEKLSCNYEDIDVDGNIDIRQYMSYASSYKTVVWGSFRRSLFLHDPQNWFWNHLRMYKMPLELNIYGENEGYSFMGFIDLFRLLYPGEDTVHLAVPLNWISPEVMMQKCGCELLLTPNEKLSYTPVITQKQSRITTSEPGSQDSNNTPVPRPTGADENPAFVFIEVKLRRPLKKIRLPPTICMQDINKMLEEMEQQEPAKRECTGRGQLLRDWESTVKCAANSLKRLPYYGTTDFCTFNRQLSETRTRVELSTSFWQDAAVYVNNNFLVSKYLDSEEMFEEMLMMAHVCLTRAASLVLIGPTPWKDADPVMKAARQARQMHDTMHALQLYLCYTVQNPRNANGWRELATCFKDIDRDWAAVCINKSVVLDPRHPLTLLSKGSMVYEEDPDAAEPFFTALLANYPFWLTGWVIASAYYIDRQMFHMADEIMNYVRRCHAEGTMVDLGYPRAWERELGDWWDQTPLLPGMSSYFDAADHLLRLRAMPLAEVCLAQVLAEAGESAAYYHLLGLSCRLRGEVEDALCHVQLGLEKYGELTFLRTLEAECYHNMGDISKAMASFDKAGTCVGAYSTLLSLTNRDAQRVRVILMDLVRRQPCAYTWLALAEDWMARAEIGEGGDAGDTEGQATAKYYAISSAVQALKYDRQAGRAWALLSKLVESDARRTHCKHMADVCGYEAELLEDIRTTSTSKQQFCHHLGRALGECRCQMCVHIRV